MQTGWVPTRSGSVYAALHRPTAPDSGTAVVLVAPFGWEAMSSARQVRAWAARLAGQGHTTVRFHAPGHGDSTGEAAAQDLSTWSGALADLVTHTRTASGAGRVAVVGMGLGGFAALLAVDAGCSVDDLVLWATPAKGRLLLRELRAFAALTGDPGALSTGGEAIAAPPEVDDDGLLWVHGYPLSAAAQRQLTDLDVTSLQLGGLRRALVLGRGTLPPDARLVQALTDQGVETASSTGPAYDDMTVEPRIARFPTATAEQVSAWLRPGPVGTPGPWPTVDIGERELRIGPVSAVLTPADRAMLTVVFLGAGALPRPGPNRLWTECARRWAPWGVTSLRVDLTGIGEAEGHGDWAAGPEGFYVESYRPQVHAVLDQVEALGLPERVLLVGLCSGGFWAAQAALVHPRVTGAVLLNSNFLVWPPPLADLGTRGRAQQLLTPGTWRELATDRGARRNAAARVGRSVRLWRDRVLGPPASASHRAPADTVQVLRVLEAKGVAVTVGVSTGEPSLPDLCRLPADSTTVVRHLEGPPGAHTLATAGLRSQTLDLLDDVVRATLSADEPAQR